jgi:hypothetical protein
MSYRVSEAEMGSSDTSALPEIAAPASPSQASPLQPAARGDSLRSSLLKKPLDAASLAGTPGSPPRPR